jgi:hypothetical protein
LITLCHCSKIMGGAATKSAPIGPAFAQKHHHVQVHDAPDSASLLQVQADEKDVSEYDHEDHLNSNHSSSISNSMTKPFRKIMEITTSSLPRFQKASVTGAVTTYKQFSANSHNAAEFVEQFVKILETKLCLDESRRQFVERQSELLFQLMKGKLTQCTHQHEILCGMKGLGKSVLLQEFTAIGKTLLGSTSVTFLTIDVYFYFTGGFKLADLLPSAAICYSLRINPLDLNQLSNYLATNRIKIFLTVDRFTMAYQAVPEHGIRFLRELDAISSDPRGIYQCVITDVSSVMMTLLDRKLPAELYGESYPSYNPNEVYGLRRWRQHTILPFITRVDFQNLITLLEEKLCTYFRGNTPNDLSKLFLETCGIPREVGFRIRTYPESHNHFPNHMSDLQMFAEHILYANESHWKVLTSIAAVINKNNFDYNNSSAIRSRGLGDFAVCEFNWTMDVDIADAVDMEEHTMEELVDMQDKGFIYFSPQNGKRVGIFSPLLYLHIDILSEIAATSQLSNRDPQQIVLTAEEVGALYNATEGCYVRICNIALIKLLIHNTAFWKRLGCEHCPNELMVALGAIGVEGEFSAKTSMDLLFRYSPNLCYIHANKIMSHGVEDLEDEVHDIGLYFLLGSNRLTEPMTRAIIAAFDKISWPCHRYILTTYDVLSGARASLLAANVTIFDALELHNMGIWPKYVFQLGRQFVPTEFK